jgi:hypothetical protein
MKVITVKAPLAWAIFNAQQNTLFRYDFIDCPARVAIHVAKSCSSLDVERFFKIKRIVTPPPSRLLLGQVIGVVDVGSCVEHSSGWDWNISNPTPIKQFDYKGQTGIYEILDDRIDFDCSKNPINEESGYKLKGNPRGRWRVTVWPHPHTENQYSFAATIDGGVMSGGIAGDTLLHGCYGDPEEALQAGIKELYL